jgi:adenylate cyclase 8
VLCQILIMPSCLGLLVSLVLTTVLLLLGCLLVMAEEFSGFPKILQKCSYELVHEKQKRTIFVCAVITLISVASSMGLILCKANSDEEGMNITFNPLVLPQSTLLDSNSSDAEPSASAKCKHTEYVVYIWVLCLIALATALKLYYLVKTCLAMIMVICYSILILKIFPEYFQSSEAKPSAMPLSAQMLILLVVFLTMVTYHARLVEVTSRLDFIWKAQAEKELLNMQSNRNLNNTLIKNILPDIVAQYYLSENNNEQLYAMDHIFCAVMVSCNFKTDEYL